MRDPPPLLCPCPNSIPKCVAQLCGGSRQGGFWLVSTLALLRAPADTMRLPAPHLRSPLRSSPALHTVSQLLLTPPHWLLEPTRGYDPPLRAPLTVEARGAVR